METLREPQVTDLGDIYEHSGYKALQSPRRPAFWGVDNDYARRPGVPSHREPVPWPHAQLDIVRMDPARSAPFKHGRTNREWPPVFGTACPPKALSGLVRKWANSFPDHKPQHWLGFCFRLDAGSIAAASALYRRASLLTCTARGCPAPGAPSPR